MREPPRAENSSVLRWDYPLTTEGEPSSETSDNCNNESELRRCTALWHVHKGTTTLCARCRFRGIITLSSRKTMSRLLPTTYRLIWIISFLRTCFWMQSRTMMTSIGTQILSSSPIEWAANLVAIIQFAGPSALQEALRALCLEYSDIFATSVRRLPVKVQSMMLGIDHSK